MTYKLIRYKLCYIKQNNSLFIPPQQSYEVFRKNQY